MSVDDYESRGTFVVEEDQLLVLQNRLVEIIASTLDKVFPPEEYGNGWGDPSQSPGSIVRQFIVRGDQSGQFQVDRQNQQ